MAELPFQHIGWDRELLPEHLWIAALGQRFGVDGLLEPYNHFLDLLDKYWPDSEKAVCLGLISDFGLIPEDARDLFVEEQFDVARDLFWEPCGWTLTLYAECPASWLVERLKERSDRLDDVEGALDRLRGLTRLLFGGRSELATRVRIVPLNRILKHGKIVFFEGLPVLDYLPKYPVGLTSEEKKHVEAFVRATMMTEYGQRDHLADRTWPKYFWRHNFDIAACRPIDESPPAESVRTDSSDLESLFARMEATSELVRSYVAALAAKVRIDLYDPRKDEILFGLFSRLSRIFLTLLDTPTLWARDMASILLRCLAETAITFAYLTRCGTSEEFAKFIEYGEGQRNCSCSSSRTFTLTGRQLTGKQWRTWSATSRRSRSSSISN